MKNTLEFAHEMVKLTKTGLAQTLWKTKFYAIMYIILVLTTPSIYA